MTDTTAPTVTPAAIEANIQEKHFFTAYEGVLGERFHHDKDDNDYDEPGIPESMKLLTICVLVLSNGFTVLGQSACASPARYNKEIGEKIAYENAFQQIWALMGYELKTKLDATEQIDDRDLAESLTHMTASAFGNPSSFSMKDADRILAHFKNEGIEA